LTEGDEDVLVNASNTNVALGSGVSRAIYVACGADAYQKHIKEALGAKFGGVWGGSAERTRSAEPQLGASMPPGEVLVTDAGTHARAKWVAHVAVMDYRPGSPAGASPTIGRIRGACVKLWEAIERIEAPGPLSVAMVALGAGVGGLGVRAPTEAACETLLAHAEAHPGSKIGRVVFYGYSTVEFMAVQEVVNEKTHGHAGHDR
jgi:O-acetyl-ADP-ribose deacetylase (regulator of RNase III)